MIKLALVQFDYLPAYFSHEHDYLSIEGRTLQLGLNLPQCLQTETLHQLRNESRATYEKLLCQKVELIIRTAHAASANLIVFPEYSIPISVLSVCKSLSKELHCTIVAGSHRVAAESGKIYATLGFDESPPPGTAIAPVFCQNGITKFCGKKVRSKWESDLEVFSESSPIDSFVEGETESISLLLCIDALLASNLGDEFKENKRPRLLICPSHSLSTTPFETVGAFLMANDCLMAYANHLGGGMTSIYTANGIIEKWDQPLLPNNSINPDEEAILRTDLDLSQIVPTKGSVFAVSKCVAPWTIPIVHTTNAARQSYESLVKLCNKYFGENKPSKATEVINNFLATNGAELDRQVYERLRSLKEVFDGAGSLKRDKCIEALRICFISEAVPSPRQLESDELSHLQCILRDRILETDADAAEIGKTISGIKHRCIDLPPPTDEQKSPHEGVAVRAQDGAERGAEWSIARFQNRGGDLNRFQQLVQNNEIAIIIVSGPPGIGKSDFIRAAVSKQFPGHSVLHINIYSGMSVSQVLTEVAVSLGLPYDTDALEELDVKSLANPVNAIVKAFQSQSDCLLFLDDLALIFRKAALQKDVEKLTAFLHAFATQAAKRMNKVVICWSGYLPDYISTMPYSATIKLKTMEDEYIRRILERQLQLVKTRFKKDADLSVDHKVVALLSGHPLSAVSLVEYARDRGNPELFRSPEIARSVIAKGLLPELVSDPNEKRCLAILACIRRPVSLVALRNYDEEGKKLADFANAFADRAAVLLPEGDGVKLHEAIREAFLGELNSDPTERRRVHSYLAGFYKSLIPNKYIKGRTPLVMRTEYVHHLVSGGLLEKTTKEARQLVTQIKRSAREIYAEDHDYITSLAAFSVAASIAPNDDEVQEAIGRCNARLQRWNDSDAAFKIAIEIGRKKEKPVAWILKNWGHIRARFNYYDRAEELFSEAERETDGGKDPSILAARAYMNWRRGNNDDAEKGFKAALERDPNHEYAMIYYIKLLRYLGKIGDVDVIESRLQKMKEADVGRRDMFNNDIFDDE
jgi:Tfp pilus assembly protein PilF/predicted amidohydrolase